jgi:hypothetical protein
LFVCDYFEERTDFEEQKSKEAIDEVTKLDGAQTKGSGLDGAQTKGGRLAADDA